MSAVFDALSTLRGERRADDLLLSLRGICGTGDELYRCLLDCPSDELRGLSRILQKEIERVTWVKAYREEEARHA